MTDDNIELTRRKLLGSVGALGVAGATAGYGTSALFTDTEAFGDDSIVAGTLDLKVDWEEHYSFPQIYDEFDDPTDGLNVTRSRPENAGGFVPFPPGVEDDEDADPLLWVDDDDVPQYMDNTAIEGFPDADNDGTAEFPTDEMFPDRRPCDVLADVPSDFSTYTNEETLGRTHNADTAEGAPLIDLADVKPGDFGEITFSTHLCDNPGYLWLQMPGGLNLEENGVTEPEAASDEEDQNEDGSTEDSADEATVELADEIRTAIWYDNNCDNLTVEDEKLDVMGVLDTSASIGGTLDKCSDDPSPTGELADVASAINTFLDDLPEEEAADGERRVRAGLLTFNGNVESGTLDCPVGVRDQPALRAGLTPVGDIGDATDFLPSEGSGDSPTPHALDLAESVLRDQGRDDARQVIVLVTDGLPDFNQPNAAGPDYTVEDPATGDTYDQDLTYDRDGSTDDDSTVEVFSNSSTTCDELDETRRAANLVKSRGIDVVAAGIDLGDTDCSPDGTPIDGDTFLECWVAGLSASDTDECAPDQFFDLDGYDTLDDAASDIVDLLVGSDGDGDDVIFTGTLREAADVLEPDPEAEYGGIPLDGDRETEDRDPFPPYMTSCFGFAWWVPTDVGDWIQTDRATFDLGFYAEQARHNEGTGGAT